MKSILNEKRTRTSKHSLYKGNFFVLKYLIYLNFEINNLKIIDMFTKNKNML
jgi:hypothetical protein